MGNEKTKLAMKKKKFSTRTASISMPDWLKSKPYSYSSGYDRPYLKLCEEVFKILNTHKEWFDDGKVDRELRKELACMLVSYFEDFTSEIGIWQAFTSYNLELHGYYLPFYDLSEYDPEYLNVEDFAYLIWHFNTKCLDTRIYAPDHPYIWDLAEEIYDLLEAEIENVPATDFYDSFWAVADGADFFELKVKLAWMSKKSYLMGWELGKRMEEEADELLYEEDDKLEAEMMPYLLYAMQEDYLYAKRCSFAAMNAPEWLSKIARCSDGKKQEINDLQYRHQGMYLYQGEEPLHYLFTHLTTDREYKVLKDSVKKNDGMGRPGKIAYLMTLVLWDGEWMLTGTMSGWDITPEEMEKAKTQRVVTPWIYPEEKIRRMRESTDMMLKAFVEFFGSPLALFLNTSELQQGMNDFLKFYHQSLGSPDPDFERRREAYKRKHGLKELTNIDALPQGHGFGLMFVEDVGISTLQNVQDTLISLKKEHPTKEEKKDLFYDLLVNYEPVVAEFLLQHFGHQNFEHPIELSKVDAWRDRHFYWRFFRPEDYGPKYPMMTEVEM